MNVLKKYAFYPVLFGINPILLMYAVNSSDVAPALLFPIILIAPLITIGLLWVINKWLKNIHRAGLVVFVLTLWFYYYIPFKIGISNLTLGAISSHLFLFPIWLLVLFLPTSSYIWRKINNPEIITLYLNILSIVLIGISIFRISKDLVPQYLSTPENSSLIQSKPDNNGQYSELPDIYYIIVDGYGRQDILDELYSYNNSYFIQSLEERGFFIPSNSQSNYMQTVLSLASSLNMDYLNAEPGEVLNHGQLIQMINRSRTSLFLEELGYKIVAFSSGYYPTTLYKADLLFSSPLIGKSHDLEALLFINSVLAPFIEENWINAPITRFHVAQERVNFTFETLEKTIPTIDSPKFVFAHIAAPHPPFIFDINGPITPDQPYILQGVDQFEGDKEEYKQAYASELIFLNNKIIQTIDGILNNSSTQPIIIIQADHGPDAYFRLTLEENACLKERFSILNAYFFPDNQYNLLYENISPVNTFPAVFNTFLGANIEIQPDKVFFATWENPYPYIDITDISQTCSIP